MSTSEPTLERKLDTATIAKTSSWATSIVNTAWLNALWLLQEHFIFIPRPAGLEQLGVFRQAQSVELRQQLKSAGRFATAPASAACPAAAAGAG